MDLVKKYKYLAYTFLALVVLITFLLSNLLINLIINGILHAYAIIYIIINLVLNFSMFYLVFRLIQIAVEKESAFEEIIRQKNASIEDMEQFETVADIKEFNTDEIIQQIIPHSPQSLTKQQFCEKFLANIAKNTSLVQGVLYVKNKENSEFEALGKYAYFSTEPIKPFYEGDSLPGQVAKDKKLINIVEVPENYFKVVSGLGQSKPRSILIFPIIEKDEVIAVAELASFTPFSKDYEKLFEKISTLAGKIIVKLK
jgi:two-component system chemotaxis sensor kinase CheA